jgi:hypothetical protein
MQLEPVDLTALIAAVMGISIVLIPVIGLTARFALKPVVEALSNVLQTRGMDESLQIVERRLDLMETQMEVMETSVRRLVEASEFDAQLRSDSGKTKDQLPSP